MKRITLYYTSCVATTSSNISFLHSSCNDFDTLLHVRIYSSQKQNILLFLKWRQKSTRPILRYSSVVNMEKSKLSNFKNPYKINKKSYSDNFFTVMIRRKRKFILEGEKMFGVSGTLNSLAI